MKEEVDPILTYDVNQELKDIVCEINKANPEGRPAVFNPNFI